MLFRSRDTHDDRVPEEVFLLLQQAMSLCPQLRYVVMEQLGAGLRSEESRKGFYDDFVRMEEIVLLHRKHAVTERINNFLPELQPILVAPVEDQTLYQHQVCLSGILETATSYDEAFHRLAQSDLANTAWNIEQWKPAMLETAWAIAQKWKKG